MPIAGLLTFPAPQVILAAGGSKIFRSENLGRRWQLVERGVLDPADEDSFVASFNRLVVDPRRPQVLYALASLHRRLEWGPPVIYRSLDLGRTWRLWHMGSAIAFDPFHPRATFVTEGNSLLVTTNDGGSFRRLSELTLPVGEALRFNEIVPDRARPGRLWATTSRGVYQSVDGGRHWQVRNLGFAAGSRTWVPIFLQDPLRSTQFLAAPDDGGLWQADFAE